MKDGEVVRRVLAGERDEYRTLVERYAPLVFGVVQRYTSNAADVEDLAQEIFVRAYEGLDGFRADASFSTWLYRIAVNRCRDEVRARRPTASLEAMDGEGDTALEALSDPEPGPAERLERRESERRLRRAIERLSPEYSVPLLLRYERDLSYREMARMLDVTAGALKVRVHRARKELRKLLRSGEPREEGR